MIAYNELSTIFGFKTPVLGFLLWANLSLTLSSVLSHCTVFVCRVLSAERQAVLKSYFMCSLYMHNVLTHILIIHYKIDGDLLKFTSHLIIDLSHKVRIKIFLRAWLCDVSGTCTKLITLFIMLREPQEKYLLQVDNTPPWPQNITSHRQACVLPSPPE